MIQGGGFIIEVVFTGDSSTNRIPPFSENYDWEIFLDSYNWEIFLDSYDWEIFLDSI
jgi:hypothetical protein